MEHHGIAACGQALGVQLALALEGRLGADGGEVQIGPTGHTPVPGGLALFAIGHGQFDGGGAAGAHIRRAHALLGEQQAGPGAIAPGGAAHGGDLSRGQAGLDFQLQGPGDALLGGDALHRGIEAAGQVIGAGGVRLAQPGVLVAQGAQLPGLGEHIQEIRGGQVRGGGQARAEALAPGADHPHAKPAPLAGLEVLQGAVLHLGLAAARHRQEGLRPLRPQAHGVGNAVLETGLQSLRDKRLEWVGH